MSSGGGGPEASSGLPSGETESKGSVSESTGTLGSCGDNVTDPGEECDDGNTDNGDDCTEVCTVPSCDDGLKGRDEADVDCGGSCVTPCPPGNGCVDDDDCQTMTCDKGVCAGAEDGMIFIPGGTFVTDNTWEFREVRQTVAAFWIHQHEVTTGEYEGCVVDGLCAPPPIDSQNDGEDSRYNYGAPERGDHPINGVSLSDAENYCDAIGARLPTEWEWEWMARGRDEGRRFPWGDSPDPSCEYAVMADLDLLDGEFGCGMGGTNPVGMKPAGATRDGVQNVAGNVSELTSSTAFQRDQFARRGTSYSAQSTDGDTELFEVSYQSFVSPLSRSAARGFRCARSK